MLGSEMEQKLKQKQTGEAPEVECENEKKWKEVRNGQNMGRFPFSNVTISQQASRATSKHTTEMRAKHTTELRDKELLFEREPERGLQESPQSLVGPHQQHTSTRAHKTQV